ncbi:MAG TPA: phospholipase D-like domain-containing protein, partial [Sphingomicrobium sp.]|nr:phospholipase D-like domain-containing protein [Sphingomicrobium sp.]
RSAAKPEAAPTHWRVERASRASLIVDADDYFRLARKAMMRAQKQILLIGWDFDTRICLDYECDDEAPTELGQFLSWLPKNRPGLQIHILKWDVGTISLLGRGTTMLRLARWAASKQIHFKLDGAHATGASHHHKIIVIDDKLAFCGGIDMTAERWDTRGHVDDDEHRRRPTTNRRYDPWHDASMAVEGDVAAALGDLSRERWEAAGGDPIAPPQATSNPWPDELETQFSNVDIQIARTRGEYDGVPAIREIEALFVKMIGETKRFFYAENQYFASRTIAEAITRRLKEEDPPEFVIVCPATGRGWLDDEVMSPARAELLTKIREHDHKNRLRIYNPVTEQREPIYVHSKITIVDDRQFRVGSANFNNRSMGLDSECDLLIGGSGDCPPEVEDVIAGLRCDLLSEHLGTSVDTIAERLAETGSLIATIDSFVSSEGRGLVTFVPDATNVVERAIADTEALDPESAGGDFEPMARPGLLARLRG